MIALALSIALGSLAVPAANLAAAEKLTPEQAKSLAKDLYYYAYPIVSMDTTMRQSTNVPNATAVPMRAPVNQFANVRTYPTADDRGVVRPNFDTLYSSAWLDLAAEPIVLTVPDTHGRYYLLEMLDFWTDVFCVVGTRTTGNKAGHYLIVGPNWSGTVPDGLVKIVAPTPMIWILGRTQTNGPADYENVHQIQAGYLLTPLSFWLNDYAAPE